MIWLARRCGSAFGSVTAITMTNVAPSAAVNHLRPLITYESPSAMAIVAIHAGFDPGKSSSVIEKQLRNLSRNNRLELCILLRRSGELVLDLHVVGDVNRAVV